MIRPFVEASERTAGTAVAQFAQIFDRRCLMITMIATSCASVRDRDVIATSLAHSALTSHKQT